MDKPSTALRLNPEPLGAGRQEAYSPEEWVFWTQEVEMPSAPYIICHHAHYTGPELGKGSWQLINTGKYKLRGRSVTRVHTRAL